MHYSSKSPSQKAAEHIADRAGSYGDVRENFQRIADLWTATFRHRLPEGASGFTAADVAQFMRLVKESRLAHSPSHRDSLEDICGYADLQGEVTGAPTGWTIEKISSLVDERMQNGAKSTQVNFSQVPGVLKP